MKAHGGTLQAASEGLDKGATFTARFKIDDSISSAANTARSAPSTDEDTAHSRVFGNDSVESKQPDHALA